ncbi:MAG: hypothetical protein RL518_2142 [Pseudomonadota bacterium]|jgi:hypothetical protein
MTFENMGPAEMLTVGIVLGALGIGLFAGIFYRAVASSGSKLWIGGAKRSAESALEEFASRVSLIEHKQRVLSVYTNEYFSTFQEAGWSNLQNLLENLRIVETSLRVMVEQRQYTEVTDVCDYLLGRASEDTGRRVARTYEGVNSVENWREESRVILLRLIQATTASAEQTAELGVARKRTNRRPTLLSLAELRDSMGDF